MEAIKTGSLVDRMIGAATLDEGTYEEIEHDGGATSQAALVVLLGALAAGIGMAREGVLALALGIIFALIGWAVYAYVVYWVGTRWFKAPQSQSDWSEALRTLGFANSPRLLLVLGVIPVLGAVLSLVVFVWTLVTTVVAIRHALDFDMWSAIATAFVAWLAMFAVSFLLGVILVGAIA